MGGGSPDRVARGLPTGGQGSKVYVLCAEPKEQKHFRPGTRPGGFGVPGREDSGTRPGGSVTGVTEELFTPPLKKITYAKKFLRNYFRGDCDTFA